MFEWLGKCVWWSLRALFALSCVAVAGYAFAYLYVEARSGDPFAAQFAVSGWDVPAHFFAAGLALLLVPLQLSASVRRRLPRLHRLGGWLYVAAVAIGAVSGLSLAQNAQGGLPSQAGFTTLSLLWPLATAIGIRHAIAGDTVAHRRWMCRSLALTTGAITLRVMLGTGTAMQWPFMQVYVAAAWLSWMFNLAVCELILRWPLIVRRIGWRARADTHSVSRPIGA
ncbi:MAG: DUF2306 domain-containing protein [Pseudomonadota bacterium]|nr:DUF2306 domain-containing protein [Pseudomonadota bacterium]